jgi:molybdenum-dependent DNA-binding transcriptional regulator ModE
MSTDTQAARRRPGDAKIVSALAAGHPYAEAASLAGVSYKTVWRRMQDPLFRAEVEEMKAQIVEQTSASLATLATKAIATLEPLMNDGEPWMRQKTALAVVELSIRYREAALLDERISALEERAREIAAQRASVG